MDLLKNLDSMITAEEFLRYKSNINEDKNCVEYLKDSEVEDIMIEFAKLHVEAALKEASEKVEVDYNLSKDYNKTLLVDENIEIYVINSSILNAYPLENIK
jgi:hypothetical protein